MFAVILDCQDIVFLPRCDGMQPTRWLHIINSGCVCGAGTAQCAHDLLTSVVYLTLQCVHTRETQRAIMGAVLCAESRAKLLQFTRRRSRMAMRSHTKLTDHGLLRGKTLHIHSTNTEGHNWVPTQYPLHSYILILAIFLYPTFNR